MRKISSSWRCWFALCLLVGSLTAWAGPPFVTDDPESADDHRTPLTAGGRADTSFNLGTVMDFTEHQHLLFSAGRSLDGPADFQVYVAWQFTFGPEFFHATGNGFGHRPAPPVRNLCSP